MPSTSVRYFLVDQAPSGMARNRKRTCDALSSDGKPAKKAKQEVRLKQPKVAVLHRHNTRLSATRSGIRSQTQERRHPSPWKFERVTPRPQRRRRPTVAASSRGTHPSGEVSENQAPHRRTVTKKDGRSSSKSAASSRDAVVRRLITAENREVFQEHLVMRKNDLVTAGELGENGNTYCVVESLGCGTFGKVYKAQHFNGGYVGRHAVALKIMEGTEEARKDWDYERAYLEQLREWDPHRQHPFVVLIESFVFLNEYPCIVTEKLGPSLYQCQKNRGFRPMPLNMIREIARQLVAGMEFLHRHGMAHTDLKLENLVFKTAVPASLDAEPKELRNSSRLWVDRIPSVPIKIIDFGSAVMDGEKHTTTVTTLQYRAPEVFVEYGWDKPVDAFSIGCILYELQTGAQLFGGQLPKEQLALMERVLGKFPSELAKTNVAYEKRYFSSSGKVNLSTKHTFDNVRQARPLMDHAINTDSATKSLFEMLKRLLRYLPAERMTMSQAKRHPFFQAK